jgi:hypothetical protein
MPHSSTRFPRRIVWGLLVLGAVAMSGRTAPSDPPKGRYVFFENTDRWVAVIRGEYELIGKLDKNGEFIHEIKLEAGAATSAGIPPAALLNGPRPAPTKAYEFRSGVLIPGEMQKDGRFVPEVGGKIIPFKDYTYTPTAPPIWNLPGVFVTEEEAAKLKKSKAADKK